MDNLLSAPLLLLLVLLLLPLLFIIVKHFTKSSFFKAQNLPPGPHPWPIIGNIPHMGQKPHISLTHLARTHGPLISLRLGTKLLVVGSSPAAASEILKTHDRLLSARLYPKAADPYLQEFSVVWAAECAEKWKSLRSLCRNELFSAKAIESQTLLREEKVGDMVKFLGENQGKVVKIGEVVFATVCNMLGQICFSKDLVDLKDEDEKVEMDRGFKELIWMLMEFGGAPNVSDFYPFLAPLDLQGLKRKFMKAVKEIFGIWEIIIKERRQFKRDLGLQKDFLDSMLAFGFSDIQINLLAMELFSAGTETSSSTVEWAMSELLKNEEAMYKVREELSKEIHSRGAIMESQISELPYLHACVKETLRLHPPAPFLIPHYTHETCEVMNYTIPKRSQVIVNVWAIGRDPMNWEDPLSFKPERFLDSHLDFRGQDFEFLPFGAGRRMCPGLPLATKQVHFILAALIYNFDWFLPNNEDASQLDMSEKFGITLQKEQSLLLVPQQKF